MLLSPRDILIDTIRGSYPVTGQAAEADCVALLEFSHINTPQGIGAPNHRIAERASSDEAFSQLPIFASASVGRALFDQHSPIRPVYTFQGISASGGRENLGTYGELIQAAQQMRELGLSRLAVVTSRFNATNVLHQAQLLNIPNPILPVDLPGGFEPRSQQLWTKHWTIWATAAPVRLRQLRRAGH